MKRVRHPIIQPPHLISQLAVPFYALPPFYQNALCTVPQSYDCPAHLLSTSHICPTFVASASVPFLSSEAACAWLVLWLSPWLRP